jgi:hypothetical protein
MSSTKFQSKAKLSIPSLQDPSLDCLWVLDRNGAPCSWIDSNGFPGGNLYQAILTAVNQSAGGRQIQTVRLQHTVTIEEVSSGDIGPIAISWPVAFADANYTVSVSIRVVTEPGGIDGTNYQPSSFSNQLNSGLNVFAINNGVAGDVIEFQVIGIHD